MPDLPASLVDLPHAAAMEASSESTARLVEALCDPACYPHPDYAMNLTFEYIR